jgi:parvulin-like peptidyl-prolyl isomerase
MRHYVIPLVIALVLLGCGGCQRDPAPDDTRVLMTVGDQEIHQDEFQRAYRVFRAAYGAEADEDSADQRARSMIRFVDQLSDEMVLMAYAQDTGVAISDEDLDRAVEEIRQDYPEGLFEQMLLETAVNFADWKAALRRRLTIERLVQQELAANVRISEADIAAYYREHGVAPPAATVPEEDTKAAQIDRMIIQQLRRQKTEEAYGPWIERIRAKYPVAIDQELLKRMIADQGSDVEESGPDAH